MYMRINFTYFVSFLWYFITFPVDLITLIFWRFVKKRNFRKYWEFKGILNEVRMYLHTFDEYKTTKYGKERIEIFKAYYKFSDNAVFIKFKYNFRSSVATDLKKFRDGLVALTGCSATEIENKKRWNYIVLFDQIEPQLVYKHDVGKVAIGTGVYGLIEWCYDQYPHALIVGETGTGKSNATRYLLNNLFTAPILLWAVDGKGVDLKPYADVFDRYVSVSDIDAVINTIELFNAEMMSRMRLMASSNVDNYRKNNGLVPIFMLIDEMSSIIKKIELLKGSKEASRVKSIISDVVRAGRAAGVQMIFAMQRPDTKFIDGEMRDNIQLRIVLGAASDTSYDMCFDRHDFRQQRIGSGWYKQGNDLSVISIPKVDTVNRSDRSEVAN